MEIKICNESQAIWAQAMLKREIETTVGTISNEELYVKGSDGEAAAMHATNIRELSSYKDNLEKALEDLTSGSSCSIYVESENQKEWLRIMLQDEISEVEGAILNKSVWADGSDGEAKLLHEMNAKELREYKDELEEALEEETTKSDLRYRVVVYHGDGFPKTLESGLSLEDAVHKMRLMDDPEWDCPEDPEDIDDLFGVKEDNDSAETGYIAWVNTDGKDGSDLETDDPRYPVVKKLMDWAV